MTRMNHLLKTLLLVLSAGALFSCSDEFIKEKPGISGVATSAIIISPDWETDEYEFSCEGVDNADFTVTSKPEWLILEKLTGKFQDSIATVYGLATKEPRYSNIGFYIDQMVVKADGKQYAVPVYYITEGNPKVQVDREFEIIPTNYNQSMQITNTGEGILLWDLLSLPSWLTINESQFNPSSLILAKGNAALLPISFNMQAATQSNLTGTIRLKTNDKNHPTVEIAVTANLGTPNLYFMEKQMSFESTETTRTSRVYNQGSGILVWNFEGLPEWISASSTGGTVMPYSSSNDFSFTCLRTNLQPGLNTATFYLKSNDPEEPSVPITVSVRVPGTGANIKAIEGNVMDATFDKNTNTLYYVTGQPNQLVAYDVTAKTVLHQVALSKAPTCLSIDEDFKKALVGHGGLISTVDISSFQVSKTYELNSTVYDMEWAIDNWFCYTNVNSTANLLWINDVTGEKYQTVQADGFYSLGTADLRKIPNQPYLIGSKKEISPTGIFVFDLETKALKSYAHQSIGNSRFIKQGELMVSGYSSIIRSSALIAATGNSINGPSAIGELKISQYANASWWIDHCEANHSIWALLSYYAHSYYPPENGKLYRFEDNDYTLVKTYSYDYMYQPDAQTAPYEVEARYVFSNSQGTELTLLRKGASNTVWSMEFMAVQE